MSSHLANGQLAAVPTRAAEGSSSWFNGQFDLVLTVNFSASYVIDHPSTGDITRLAQETWAADEIRIYVGMRQLISSSIIGEGKSAEVGISRFGFGYAPSWNDAVNTAANNATGLFQRGGNVLISTVNGEMPYTGNTGDFDASGLYRIGIGPTAGTLWLNANAKWDTARGFWDEAEYDGTTHADEYSLYSVALRQMMLALGAEPATQIAMGQQMDLTEADLQALRKVIAEFSELDLKGVPTNQKAKYVVFFKAGLNQLFLSRGEGRIRWNLSESRVSFVDNVFRITVGRTKTTALGIKLENAP